MIEITPDATDQTIDVFIADSSSTTGAGLTSLLYNSSGLQARYRRGATGSLTTLTLATQTVNGAHVDGGFVEIGDGLYRLDLSDAVVADGVDHVTLLLSGASNMAPTPVRIKLDAKVSSRMATFTLPTNFSDLAITASTGLVSVGTNNDKSGYSITGTLTTLDALDNAQDTRHTGTQSDIQALDLKVDTIDSIVDAILADTADMQPRFAGITSYPNLFALMMRKDGTYLTELAEINALGGGGGTYSETTDAQQAIRDRADTEFNSLATDVENISEAVLTDGVALSTATLNSIATALLDLANGVETGYTVRQVLRIIGAAVAGESSGQDANSPVFRSLDDSADRVTATTSSDGRSSVTHNA